MNPEQESFERLRQILALKRHEQPPPGFFHGFSRQVIVRIQAGDRADTSVVDRLFGEPRWLQRLLAAFETKPLVAGSFGLIVCGFLTAGMLFSDTMENPGAAFGPAHNSMQGLATWHIAQSAPADDQLTPISLLGTNRAVPSPLEDSLFRRLQGVRLEAASLPVLPVGFSPPR